MASKDSGLKMLHLLVLNYATKLLKLKQYGAGTMEMDRERPPVNLHMTDPNQIPKIH